MTFSLTHGVSNHANFRGPRLHKTAVYRVMTWLQTETGTGNYRFKDSQLSGLQVNPEELLFATKLIVISQPLLKMDFYQTMHILQITHNISVRSLSVSFNTHKVTKSKLTKWLELEETQVMEVVLAFSEQRFENQTFHLILTAFIL